jgi:membrane protease subunit HflC
VLSEPGYHLFVPWLQELHLFDKSPNEYRMEGELPAGINRAPQLSVRANDGSSFYFESLSLHYALLPERGSLLLEDSGPGERFKATLPNAFARAVLRDEFGRFSAEEIVEPQNLHTAVHNSQTRLNELLLPHGVVVLEITTPKPRFDPEYETAIERRKVADQEVQHLQAKRLQLDQEKLQREARANREKEIERRGVLAELEQQLLVAQRDDIRVRTDADIFYEEKLRAAATTKAQKEQQARDLELRYRMENEGLTARLAALAERAESVLRAALIDKLRSIEISLVPYSRDASPKELEYRQITPPKPPN